MKNAFAKSVNPVFGKLGALYLGKDGLESYARAFGFNHPINFEISLSPSETVITDEPYQWAEIASGFNRQTKMSPVHGALIAATIFRITSYNVCYTKLLRQGRRKLADCPKLEQEILERFSEGDESNVFQEGA